MKTVFYILAGFWACAVIISALYGENTGHASVMLFLSLVLARQYEIEEKL